MSAGLADNARRNDGSSQHGNAAQHMLYAKYGDQSLAGIDPVLHRDQGCLWAYERSYLFSRALHVPQLDAEHDHVHDANLVGLVGSFHLLQVNVSPLTFDTESIAFYGCKMRSTREEANVVTCVLQRGTQECSRASCANNSKAHATSSLQTIGGVVRVCTS